MEKNIGKKVEFIRDNLDTFRPVTGDNELLDFLEARNGFGDVAFSEFDERVEDTVENYETKIFSFKKENEQYDEGAQKILITASETLSFVCMSAVIEKLKSDRRCREICLLTDGMAGKKFEEDEDNGFAKVRKSEQPVIADILSTAEEDPYDIVLVSIEPPNSANSIGLYAGKDELGASKLYLMCAGYIGLGSGTRIFQAKGVDVAEDIDAIFCNDQFSKKVLSEDFPDFPQDRILTTGTPILDTIKLDEAQELSTQGRDTLGLDGDRLAVLYLGDFSSGYQEIVPSISNKVNERTFQKTLNAMIKLAEENPEKKYSLLLRPHPADPNQQELYDIADINLPDNLTIIDSSKDVVGIDQVVNAADMVVSIISTENFLAAKRGKKGIFLGFDEKLGKDIIDYYYNKGIQSFIKESGSVDIASTEEELMKIISKEGPKFSGPVVSEAESTNSTEAMIDVMFAEKDD